jgi:hypothetical protein
MKRTMFAIFASSLGILSALGCSNQRGDDPNSGSPGADTATGQLAIAQMSESDGKMTLQYTQDDHKIQIQLILGPSMAAAPTAEDLAANPELPTREVDMRVLDAEGRTILLQAGGHVLADPEWNMQSIEGFDEAERNREFLLLRDAVPALRALDLPPSLEELRLAAISVGLGIEETPNKPEIQEELAAATAARKVQSVVARGPSSVVLWDFVVRDKCFPACGVGNHSAVYLRGWSSSNSIVFRAYSCNHGTCASDTSVMKDHCVMPGFKSDDGSHSRYFYVDGCTTDYNVTSIWGHNCNDDSELQGRAIWRDSPQSTSGGSCDSIGPHNWSPGCSY